DEQRCDDQQRDDAYRRRLDSLSWPQCQRRADPNEFTGKDGDGEWKDRRQAWRRPICHAGGVEEGLSSPHAFSGNPGENPTGPLIETFRGDTLGKFIMKFFTTSHHAAYFIVL